MSTETNYPDKYVNGGYENTTVNKWLRDFDGVFEFISSSVKDGIDQNEKLHDKWMLKKQGSRLVEHTF